MRVDKGGETVKIKVAVTSSDGKVIDQHFGRCSNFRIAEMDRDSGEWQIVENRQTEQTCHNFAHQEEHVKEVVKLLSDCSYLLTYRIGIYPYSLFRSWGITCFETPTEEPQTMNEAFKNLQKYLVIHQLPSVKDSGLETETKEAERKGIHFK